MALSRDTPNQLAVRTPVEFFTLSELVARVGCDRQTLRRHTVWKGCPYTLVGEEAFFVTELFVEWLKSRTTIIPPGAKGKEKCPGSLGCGGGNRKHQHPEESE